MTTTSRWPPREHPDPGWHLRFEKARVATTLDLCEYCCHIRQLHDAAGCKSKCADLYTNSPCQCTNLYIGTLYRSPLAF